MKTEKNSQISNITKEYLEGRYSNETEEKVQQWLTCDENSEEKEEGSLEYWNTIQSKTDSSTYPALRRVLDSNTPTNPMLPYFMWCCIFAFKRL